MTRLVVLTRNPDHLPAVAARLAAIGGVVANQTDSVVTVIVPMLGPVVVNCVVGEEWVERLARYGDAVGVAVLAGGDADSRTDPATLTATAGRVFGGLPIVVGVAVEPTGELIDQVATALDRPVSQVPIYRVDGTGRDGILVLLATLLSMADEIASGPRG